MPSTPTLRAPYELGFEVRFGASPLWSVERDVFVGIDLKEDASAEAFEEYDALVTTFYMLASTGALSGSQIDPERSIIADSESLSMQGNKLRFVLRNCLLDDLSTVLCANALSLGHERFPIDRVFIAREPAFPSASGRLAYDPKHIDPYPALYSRLSFPVDLDPDQDAPTAFIEFARSPDHDAETTIEDQLLTWAAACAGGLYGAVMAPPADCFISFDPADMEFVDNMLRVPIFKFRCHEAALRGLVNACAVLHATVAPIVSVSIR